MNIDLFMEQVKKTTALENTEYKELLCELARKHINLEQVNEWISDITQNLQEQKVAELATLMEVHPLGFEKYVLWNQTWDGPRIRLHYWPENKWPFESIHDHRFNFCAIILCGSYTHENYEVTKKDGEEEVQLELTDSVQLSKGDVYYFPAGSFHRVIPSEETTLSLVIRSAAILPYSRVIDPKTRILKKAFGAQNKFRGKLNYLSHTIFTQL